MHCTRLAGQFFVTSVAGTTSFSESGTTSLTATDTEASKNAEGAAPIPEHAQSSVNMIGQIHARYEAGATFWQRRLESLTRAAGTATFCALVAVLLSGWVGWQILWMLGRQVSDPQPFFWIDSLATGGALLMTALILATQRRADEFAEGRERLMLELAVLADNKSSKLIELIEQLRQDHPQIVDRPDNEARDMARPVDPKVLFDAVAPAAPATR